MKVADIGEVQTALSYLDPSDRDLWVRLGMAVKVELGAAGFDVWDEWSSSALNYKAKAAKSTWKSFKDSGRVGIGTLFFLAKERGYQPSGEAHVLTAEEIAARHERQAAAERAIVEEQARVSDKALGIWRKLPDSGKSDYLQRKGVGAFGVRFAKGGAIALPAVDVGGKLWGLQFIQADGNKVFLSGMRKHGCFHRIKGGSVLAFAEGYATGATIHMATGWSVMVCFTGENLKPVAVSAREKWPERVFVVCGDDDRSNPKNPGRKHASEVASLVGAKLVFPEFDS